MRRCFPLMLAVCACAAVAVADGFQQPSAPPAGSILGRVVDAQSNTPIAGVMVVLGGGPMPSAAGPRQPESRVLTDAQGRFVFRGLAKGSYQLVTTVGGNGFSPNGFIVSGSGFPIGAYLNGGFGQRRPNGPLQVIDLAEGERLADALIRLWKPGAVGGQVFDEAGEPLVNQIVGVVQMSGDGRLLNGPTTKTDDRGAYRLGTLPPGMYVVFVPQLQVSMPLSVGEALAAGPPDPVAANRFAQANAPSPTLGGVRVGASVVSTTPDSGRFGGNVAIANALAPVRDGNQLLAYATTFAPSATTLAQAVKITLAPGEERSHVDVTLRPVPTVSVSGVVMDSSGPVPHFGVHLMPGSLSDEASVLEVATTATDAHGAFTLPAVPRGSYTLLAVRTLGVPTGNPQQPFAEPTRVSEQPGAWAAQPIAVGDRPVDNAVVTVRAPVSVSGRVEFSGSSERPPAERLRSGFIVTIWRARSFFRSPDPAPGSTIDMNAGGRISVRGLPAPGRYGVGVPALPAPWSLESVTIGGRDVTDAIVPIEDTDITDLVITYTDRPASLGGTVTADRGAADAGISVFMFPANRARWADARTSARTFRVMRASKTGAFTWSNVPPGDYLVAALQDDDAADWPEERFITRLSAVATPVTVSASQPAAIALKESVLR